MPEIVQDIGAYAGLASVVGLAVLSVLYFSQARDVKRLREWAGRAPERAEQGTGIVQPTPGKAMPQPQAQPRPQAQQQPQPAKAPAVPAAAGAQPAAAGAGAAAQQKQGVGAPKAPATPAPAAAGATATAKPAAATAQTGAAPTALKQGKPPAAQPQTAPDSGQPGAGQAAPAGATPAGTAAPPVPGAPRPAPSAASGGQQGGPPPAPPQARPQPAGRPAPQQTAIIPPKHESWHQRIFGSSRNLILAVCGVLLLGAGVALALTQLSGDDPGGSPSGQPAQEQPAAQDGGGEGEDEGRRQRRNRPAIDPASVTVAVLNGTTVPGLAARVSDEVQSAGFEVGTVANSSDQQRAESVILYAPGHEREAAAVSRRLDIAQREPIDAATQGLAGDATVVVVTGADRS